MTRRPVAALVLPIALGMAVHSMVAGAAESPGGSGGRAVEPVRPIRYATQLRANLANIERDVVRDVCEQPGIRKIAEILQQAEFEEMWAFLPRARGNGGCEWHEIGREERDKRRGSTLRVDMDYLMQLMAENSEIHLLHFHPLRHFQCAGRSECPAQAPRGSAAVDERWITDLVFSMPSPSDIHFMMNATSRFFRRQQGGTIRHKVVTPYGVVEYGLTEQGLAKYDAERLGRSEGLYITWVAASALDDERIEQVVRENPASLGAAVSRLAQTLNTEFLRVLYTPRPE
jgi:hypothetical protein